MLHLAASYIDPYYLQTILEVQPNINIDFEMDKGLFPTPLLQAMASQRFENFKILLNHGADIEKKNSMGDTPIDSSNGNGAWQFAYELLQRGADYKGGLVDLIGGEVRDKPEILEAMEFFIYHPTGVINFRGTDYRQKVVEFLRDKGVEVHPWMPEDEEYRYEDGVAVLYIKRDGKWIKFTDSDEYDPNDFDPDKQKPLE